MLFILCGFLAICLVVPNVSWADVLIPLNGKIYQNSTQNPCVIHGNGNCTNPAGWEELGPTQGDFGLTTETGINAAGDYITVGELRAALVVPSNSTVAFLLGVELNENNGVQTDLILQVFIGSTYYYDFTASSIPATLGLLGVGVASRKRE